MKAIIHTPASGSLILHIYEYEAKEYITGSSPKLAKLLVKNLKMTSAQANKFLARGFTVKIVRPD